MMSSETTTAEKVYRQISQVIRDRNLQSGDRVPSIRVLAKQLGVNPNSVRDGLLYGQSQGLVRVLPRAGAFVGGGAGAKESSRESQDSPSGDAHPASADGVPRRGDYNVFHLLDARRTVEVELAVRAARYRRLEDLEPVRRTLEQMAEIPELQRRTNYVDLDIHFHIQIARLGENNVLADLVADVLHQLRDQLRNLSWTTKRRCKTDASHVAIYQALISGDEQAVRGEMEQHLQAAYDTLLRRVRTAPIADVPVEDNRQAISG